MAIAFAVSTAIRPTKKIAEEGTKVDLETMVPRSFGQWQEEDWSFAQAVNPQQLQLMGKLYTQTLTRTYRNPQGYRVILSIAYGDDQRDAIQLHYPEICYPAQGFQLLSNVAGRLRTSFGEIPVRRLETSDNRSRFEPITYWTIVGNHAVVGQIATKITKMTYSFRGLIPDGLVFRVSSIDTNSSKAFGIHEEFVGSLVPALDPSIVPRLTGLSANQRREE
jgi:EpsI family protein